MDRLGHAHAEALPTLGSAWAPRLADAGWEVADERQFPIDLDPPAHPRPPSTPAPGSPGSPRGSPTSLSPATRRRSRRCWPATARR